MSDYSQDFDLSHWPEDPYELLGVSYGVSPRDLRRAYTGFIRTFKPEQYPEHFRRIRDAYENILRDVEFYGFANQAAPPAEPSDSNSPPSGDQALSDHLLDETPTGNDSLVDPDSPGADGDVDEFDLGNDSHGSRTGALESLEEQLHRIWEQVCQGKEEEAYYQLLALNERNLRHPEICVRLYWLLRLEPDLAEADVACDWLVWGLLVGGLFGNCRELYRREIEWNPAEALSQRFWRIMESTLSPELLLDVVGWRWQAASRLQRWDLIPPDVEFLADPFRAESDEMWVRLLLAAVDHLAWAPDSASRRIVDRYCQQINQCGHLAHRLSAEWDRVELLRELSDGYRLCRANRVLLPLSESLIPDFWLRPFVEIRSRVVELVCWVANNTRRALQLCDWIRENASSVLAQFGSMLDQLQFFMEEPPQDPEISDMVARLTLDFLNEHEHLDFETLRPLLLDFCLRENLAPEQAAQIVQDRPRFQLDSETHLTDMLTSDWPLRYVFQAHRLFWA